MFTSNEIETLSMSFDSMMRRLENEVMLDIIRRIAINGEITRAADWQINRLYELGKTKQTIDSAIKRALNLSENDIEKMFSDVIESGYARNEDIYKKAGVDFVPFDENETLQKYISAVALQTAEKMTNISQSLGFAVKNADGTLSFKPIAEFYQDTLDNAINGIANGVFDYNTALKKAVSEMVQSGLRSVDYASGWSNRVDVATRRAVMTGVAQLTGKVNEMSAKELGTDTFEVTWHSGARPSHQVWQGKWYTMDELVSQCGLGTVTGLNGANCYHDYYPVIPGISQPTYTEAELEEMNRKENTPVKYGNKEYTKYEALQRQRRLETTMRAQRQKIKLLKEGGADEEDIIAARARYRATSAEYTRFSKAMDLPQQRDRVTIDGLGNIGVGKWKKVLKKSSKNVKINKNNGIIYNSVDEDSLIIMPNAITASTSKNKIQGYLLNSNHPVGKHKAKVIRSVLGYHFENWYILSDKIFDAIQTTPVSKIVKTKYGVKYEIPVSVTGTKNRNLVLRTVWQVDNSSNIPRLITITFNKKNSR